MSRRNMKKTMLGLLAVVTLIGSLLSPVSVLAEEIPEEEKKPPLYEEVQDLLDENEIVTAKNLGIDLGSVFDLENDFSNIEIPDEETVKVTFEEAKNAAGEEFSTEKLEVFEAVYYVEPLKTDHPKYQISRKLIVKEPGTEINLEDEEMQEEIFEETVSVEESENVEETTVPELEEVYALPTEPTAEDGVFSGKIFSEVEQVMEFAEAETIETEPVEIDMEEPAVTENIDFEEEIVKLPITETEEVMEVFIPEEGTIVLPESEVKETVEEITGGITEEITEEITSVTPAETEEDTVSIQESAMEEVSMDTEVSENTNNGTCDAPFRARLKIVKQDHETGRMILIPNTEFKVYDLERQEYVEQVTSYPSTYVHKSYFTDSQGCLVMPECLDAGMFRIEEVQAPMGYVRNTEGTEVCIDQEYVCQIDEETGEPLIAVVMDGHAVKGKLSIRTQGNVLYDYQDGIFLYRSENLAGAEYGIYAAEDICSPDYQKSDTGERTIIFPKGALVATVTTDEEGTATAENLPLGLYEICEKNAAYGYVCNSISKMIRFDYKDQETDVIREELLFSSERQKVEICAVQHDAENGSAVEGMVLGLYNKEDIKNWDGETILQADSLIQKQETGEDGKAVFSTDIPFGQYYVKEFRVKPGYVSADETLYFNAEYQGQDVSVVQLHETRKNPVTTVEITVEDRNTGVGLGGASMSLLDKEGNLITSWTSQKEHPQIIKRLKAGKTYILHEELASYGYLQEQDLMFTVENSSEVQKITMHNEVPKAVLILNEDGQFLGEAPQNGTGSGKKVSFSVYAAEDIKAADGVSADHYKKDEFVGKITTDDKGIAQMHDLWAGRYYVKKEGSDTKKYVDLSYRDQETALITYSEEWQEERRKAEVSVINYDKETKTALSGTVFGLFSAEEIRSSAGKVLYEKDQMIEKQSTDDNGRLMFQAELLMDQSYYIRELTAASGYVTNETVKDFILEYDESKNINTYEFVFEDEKTTVEFVLKDLKSGEQVSGAKIRLCNETGDQMDNWVSGKNVHVVSGLETGETFTVYNTIPAPGYITAEKVQFMVKDTAEVQKIEVVTDVTKLLISKKSVATQSEIPGAKLVILGKNDQVVESWTTDGEAHYVEKLPIGSYQIREELAAKGYVISPDVSFELEDSGKVQSVSMVNETAKGKMLINLMDADTEEPLMGVEFEIRDEAGNVLETLRTDAAGHAESGLYEIANYKKGVMKDSLTYHLVQTKNLQGYVLDDTVHKISFTYENDSRPIIEVTLDLKNGEDSDNPHTPGTATKLADNPKTGDDTNIWFSLLMMFVAMSLIIGIWTKRRKINNR